MVETKKKKSIFKKWWFYVGIIAALALIGAIQDLADNGKIDSPKESAEVKKDNPKEEKVDSKTKEVATTPKEEKLEEPKKNTEQSSNDENIGTDAVAALESNDFIKFVEEYKKLGTNKTPVWDEKLNGKTVKWTGTVIDPGSSQVYLYGNTDYKGESWSDLGSAEGNKLFYSFVAKYDDPSQFEGIKQGDTITVEGSLDSRGDYELNYNWKIYNAKLIQ